MSDSSDAGSGRAALLNQLRIDRSEPPSPEGHGKCWATGIVAILRKYRRFQKPDFIPRKPPLPSSTSKRRFLLQLGTRMFRQAIANSLFQQS